MCSHEHYAGGLTIGMCCATSDVCVWLHEHYAGGSSIGVCCAVCGVCDVWVGKTMNRMTTWSFLRAPSVLTTDFAPSGLDFSGMVHVILGGVVTRRPGLLACLAYLLSLENTKSNVIPES